MPSDWINHVKAYQAEHNVSYKEAMKQAKDSYKSMAKSPPKQKSSCEKELKVVTEKYKKYKYKYQKCREKGYKSWEDPINDKPDDDSGPLDFLDNPDVKLSDEWYDEGNTVWQWDRSVSQATQRKRRKIMDAIKTWRSYGSPSLTSSTYGDAELRKKIKNGILAIKRFKKKQSQ